MSFYCFQLKWCRMCGTNIVWKYSLSFMFIFIFLFFYKLKKLFKLLLFLQMFLFLFLTICSCCSNFVTFTVPTPSSWPSVPVPSSWPSVPVPSSWPLVPVPSSWPLVRGWTDDHLVHAELIHAYSRPGYTDTPKQGYVEVPRGYRPTEI